MQTEPGRKSSGRGGGGGLIVESARGQHIAARAEGTDRPMLVPRLILCITNCLCDVGRRIWCRSGTLA